MPSIWLSTVVLFVFGSAYGIPAAPSLLEKAREACGGSARLAAVSSLRITGSGEERNLYYGQNESAASEFERSALRLLVLMPGHYLSIEQIADGMAERYTGLAGPTLLNGMMLQGQFKPWEGAEAMSDARSRFARLMLLLLLRTDTSFPLTPKAASSSSLQFTGADGFEATIDLAPDTGRPISLSYNVRMHGTGEMRTYVTKIDERRTFDGISLPVRMTTTALGKTFGRTTYETIEINPRLTQADFTKAIR
jgi:hypothetical protein